MSGYISPFIIGGTTVAGIKYLSNIVDPKFAAVLGALPIGLFSTFYIKGEGKLDSYLTNYMLMCVILVITAGTFKLLLLKKISRTTSYASTIVFWLLIVIVKLFLI